MVTAGFKCPPLILPLKFIATAKPMAVANAFINKPKPASFVKADAINPDPTIAKANMAVPINSAKIGFKLFIITP